MDRAPTGRSQDSCSEEQHPQTLPGLSLQGASEGGILNLPEGFLGYLRSLLRGEPSPSPKAPRETWLDFLSVVACHGILPLLYWRIDSLPPESHPPPNIIDLLRESSLRSLVHSVLMERQLREVTSGLEMGGVRALVLKGPALAWSAYPSPALRPSVDLDILICREHMRQSRTILEGLNYRCMGKTFDTYEDIFCDEEFIPNENTRDNRPIELHWHLHPFFGSSRKENIGEFFCRAIKVVRPPLAFEALHPVDALIHAAIHLTMHHNRQMRLIWIHDIALLARGLKVPEDWTALQERSVQWRARLAVENSLKLAKVWTGLTLPDGFDDFDSWPGPTETELDAWANAVQRHERKTSLMRLHVPRTESIPRQIHAFLRLVFPPADRIRQTYPPPCDWLLPLSYVHRWLRWIIR